MQRTKKVSVFLGVGLFVAGTAVLADRIGFTLGEGWGKFRILLLVLGLLICLVPWLTGKRSPAEAGSSVQNDLFAFPAVLLVMIVYFWFLTISHDLSSNYYMLLANSFRKGELSLSLRPDPALLELENPYDPAARQGIKVPLDLSLYNGKFYLYWGAAPALLLAIARPLLAGEISDGYLLLAFVYGIFLLQFLLIMHIRERFFPNVPTWMVVLAIFIAGSITPTLWLLSQPKIYEGAIAGGQFFFLAGLYTAIIALDRPVPSGWRLVLAGIFWSLAVGTRSVALFPVAFMTLMVTIWFYRLYRHSFPRFMTNLIPLGVPLLIGAITFGWYNWARFGSLAETGFNYAMAGPYLQKYAHELFLPDYIFQNLYNYLFNPLKVTHSFPFLAPVRGTSEAILPWQVLPEIYSAQAITGLLWVAPFAGLAIVPVALRCQRLRGKNQNGNADTNFFRWIVTSLTGSFLSAFICLLFFFWTAMRYTEDFMPTLTLLGILGFWQLSQHPAKGKIYTALGLILAGLSILSGTLLAFSIYSINKPF